MREATAGAVPPGMETDETARAPRSGAAWERLEEQLAWYDAKSGHAQHWYKRLKVCQIVVAAAIPVAAAADVAVAVIGAAGALIVVLEGLQQLQQYQQTWTTYRSTCERLKHEKHLYLACAGPYVGAARPEALLAERVEGLVSQEHAAWVSQRRDAGRQDEDGR